MTYQEIIDRIDRAYSTAGLTSGEVREILVDYRELLTKSNSSSTIRGAITEVLGDIAAGDARAAKTIDHVAANCSTYERYAEVLEVNPGATKPDLIAAAAVDPYPIFDGLRFLYGYRTLGRVGNNVSVLRRRPRT
jgi:hypothetical protein